MFEKPSGHSPSALPRYWSNPPQTLPECSQVIAISETTWRFPLSHCYGSEISGLNFVLDTAPPQDRKIFRAMAFWKAREKTGRKSKVVFFSKPLWTSAWSKSDLSNPGLGESDLSHDVMFVHSVRVSYSRTEFIESIMARLTRFSKERRIRKNKLIGGKVLPIKPSKMLGSLRFFQDMYLDGWWIRLQ